MMMMIVRVKKERGLVRIIHTGSRMIYINKKCAGEEEEEERMMRKWGKKKKVLYFILFVRQLCNLVGPCAHPALTLHLHPHRL